jgi:hypothetical protein
MNEQVIYSLVMNGKRETNGQMRTQTTIGRMAQGRNSDQILLSSKVRDTGQA